MPYPGNDGLTQEMQERILSTFQQTLTAAAAGNRKEALLGCDFILRLDSLFAPARELHDRLETGEGPVETADLVATIDLAPAGPESSAAPEPKPAAAATAAAAAQKPAIDELEDLDLALAPEPAAAEPASETAPPAAAAEATAPGPLPDLDGLDELAKEEPPLAAPPETPAAAPEESAPAAAAAPESAAAPAAAPEAPSPPGLDELDDLDLSIGGEAEPEPAAAPEAAAPADQPPAAPQPPAEPEPPVVQEPPQEAAPAEAEGIPLGGEPAAQLDSESQQRITDLLAEGQEAFDGGEYQGAIDAWSRIFLIDIDHGEANRRIEEARKLKAEADRKVEEKFHEGLAALEGGDTEAAAESFRAVLAMQSSHLAARDYLEKLDAGEVPVPVETSRPAADEEAPAVPGLDEADVDLADEMAEPAKPRPDRGTKAVGPRMVSVKKSPFKSRLFLIIAGAGLIAVLGGGWYLFNNWSSLFPNSASETEATTARPDPVARAKGLHAEGKTSIAIAQLRRLPPASPQYDEAQALIAQWELELAPADAGPDGPSPEELARREALIGEAGVAAERREFMRTSELLSAAATIAPLRGAEVQLLARADEQLQELQNFITYFREGQWEFALRDLWLLNESDPGNRDVARLLVDSYYNLGVRDLQRSDPKAAAERFREGLGLSPEDPELQRLADFAEIYQTRSPDLLYRIFVKYVPFR